MRVYEAPWGEVAGTLPAHPDFEGMGERGLGPGFESKLDPSMRVYEAPWDEVAGTLSAPALVL